MVKNTALLPLRKPVTALGCVLALALGMVQVSDLPATRGPSPGEPRPELVAAELLAGPADEPVEALIVLGAAPDGALRSGDRDAAVRSLKHHAHRSQREVVRLVADQGAEVLSEFWIHNAVAVRSLPGTLLTASGVDSVARIVPNFEVTAPDPADETAGPGVAIVDDRTWGIDRIQAHRVWQEEGLDGSGVRVATLDTGVDPTHPDLAGKLATDNPDDPFYPGGWIAFAGGGEPFPIEPQDTHGHGTHVAGTIHGADTTGVAIGVAPGAEMMHAMVLPGGSGDFANIIAGMQWAVEPHDQAFLPAGEPADVVNMSLGEVGYADELIDPVRNLEAAGVVPVVAIGNDCGLGNTTSPGNVHEALAVGATAATDDVADFSCGARITRDQWDDPPADWPDSYVKPDLSAPGVEVYSAVPGGSHAYDSGTSMATPHVAGTAALMRQAVPDLPPADLRTTLAGTAFFDHRHGPERPNARFGHGRIDAHAAVTAVLPDSGVGGTVTDDTGAPLDGVTAAADGAERVAVTDDTGGYTLRLEPGTYDVSARRFGYETATEPGVEVVAGALTPVDFALPPLPTGTISGVARYEPSGHGVPGATVEVRELPAERDLPMEAVTDRDGGFALELPEGGYGLRASAPQLRDSAEVEVTVTDGGVTEVALLLRPLGRTAQVDVASDGTAANAGSGSPSIGADGRFVAFHSTASNLVPGVTNGVQDVYVRDRLTGLTERVSVASDGTESNGPSRRPAISADGRFVAFGSFATNLVDGPPASGGQTFVHDRATGETELVSQSTGGEPASCVRPGACAAGDAAISGGGRYVLFGSQATNLVPGADRGHIYLRDRVAGTTEIASVGSGGVPANNTSLDAGISDDGTQVSFVSAAGNLDENIRNDSHDVFVHDRTDSVTRRVSVTTDGQESSGNRQAVISGDGRMLAWDTRFDELVDDDTNDVYDVFVHDRDTGETTRVSLSSDGEQGNQNSRNPAVSGNGRYVAFDSASDTLAEGVTNNATDVFVHDRATGQTTRDSLAVDGAEGDGSATQKALDHDGRFLAFRSFASNLVEHQTSARASLFIRDRFGPNGPQPQFAVSDLRVDEPAVLSSHPVTVSATVVNIGGAEGVYPAQLRVDGRPEASADITLAPGESQELEWTVAREQLGGYDVQVGPRHTSFRVRAPEVDLSVSTVDGAGHDAAPMADATVELRDSDGELRQVGVTDADGKLRFETTAPDASYTILVRRPPQGGHELAYLLARPQRVDDDTAIEIVPRTTDQGDGEGSAAVVDLALDPVSGDHQAWTYLQHPLAAPHGFAVAPGRLVTTVAAPGDGFEAVNVHAVAGLERDTWAVSETVRGLDWHDPVGYEYRLGGPATASLAADLVEGTTAEVSWSLVDAAGHEFAELRRTGLRPFAATANVPPSLPLDQVTGMVADRAPQPAEVILRLFDPDGQPRHAGGVGWHERTFPLDLADVATGLPAGRYELRLEVDAGKYGGDLRATTTLRVDEPVAPGELLLVLSETPEVAQLDGDRDRVVEGLKQTAARSQDEVIARLTDDPGRYGEVRVVNRFWLQNMLLVELEPAAGVSASGVMDAMSALDGVDRVVPNFDVSMIEPAEADPGVAIVDDRTWGVDRIGAHRVHQELSLDGSGVVVATLDTGVDTGHPDLTGRMVSDDPGDPAHPGGWLEFDGSGRPVPSEPHDSAQHGTHVSGTIHGGDAGGVQIGVAPGAGMMHGLVLPGGQGTFAQVAAGMQWAIDPFDASGAPAGQPADVINMSLGAEGLHQELVTPTRNLRLAGVFPSISIGNDCAPGGTGTPGNVYEAVGIGATDSLDDVASFSCGGTVEADDWPAPPAGWPDSYVKPDLSAPGVDTYSSIPGGGYARASGTSMATPHVAGTAALLRQADPEAGVDQLVGHLADTSFFDGRHGPERPNARFGHGRIDAYQATLAVAVDSGITGLVTDADTGAPIAGARVENVDTGASVTTGDDGSYRMRLQPGSYDLAVEAFGYEPATAEGIEVEPETFTTRDVPLDRQPWGGLEGGVVVDGSGHGLPGVAIEVVGTPLRQTTGADGSFHIPEIPVGEYEITAAPGGLAAPPSQTVTIDEGETTTVTFTVPEPAPTVGLLGDRNGSIGEFLDDHDIPHEDIDWDADVTRYGAIVVNQPPDPGEQAFRDFLSATDAAGTGVIFHDGPLFGTGGEHLHNYLGNPAQRQEGFSGSIDHLSYQVTGEHPVLAGFEVGEEIVLGSPDRFWSHAWFDGYAGDNRRVVADLARNDLGVVGRGIGVQQRENNRHVLLSMHATGSVRRTGHWGPDGAQVFRNALDWVTPDREDGFPIMVPWGLTVTPEEVLSGDEAEVSVHVTNVGTAPGGYEAVLRVDGEVEDTTVTTVADGDTATVTWTVSRDALATYRVAVGPLQQAFRVRAPHVALTASTLQGAGHDSVPMAGATVALIDDGRQVPVGTTDEQGQLTFETTRADASYTLVVRRPSTDDHDLAYLLARPEHIDSDTTVQVAPHTAVAEPADDRDLAALVDLQADPPADDHQAWTYLRHPLAAPHSYAYAPGQLVTSIAEEAFEAVNVHVAPGLERDWWAVSEMVDALQWSEPLDYRYRFGGPVTPSLAAGFVDQTDFADFQVDWAVTDDHGHRLAALRSTRLRAVSAANVSVPGTVPLEQVEGMVARQAPVAAEAILRLSDPDGTPIHAGGLDWGQWRLTRDLADLADDVGDGVYPLELEIDAGTLGQLAGQASLMVDTEGPVLDWAGPRDGQGFFDPAVTVAGTATDEPAGVAEVRVDGEPAQLDAGGAWHREVSLAPGETDVTVTAVDHLGNETTQTRTVALLDYTTQWLVPGGVAPTVSVGLRILDADGPPTEVSRVMLEARAADGNRHGPFEMTWRGQHYRHLLRDLPPGGYELVAELEVEGWTVVVAGPTIAVGPPGPGGQDIAFM